MSQTQKSSNKISAACETCDQQEDFVKLDNDDWQCVECGEIRRVELEDKNRENTKTFPTVAVAEDKKSRLRGLGAKPEDLEIEQVKHEPGETTNDSKVAEADESRSEENATEDTTTENGDSTDSTESPEQPEFVGRDEPDEEPTEVIHDPKEPIDIDSEEQFVTEIKGVPDTFVVDMGGSPHIRKEGYYYLAAEMGLEIQTEPLNPTWDGDNETSAWKGIVKDGEKTWSNVGTAHLQHEDMQGAGANLDELASTRAACRALSMATGTGIASMEEMMGSQDG